MNFLKKNVLLIVMTALFVALLGGSLWILQNKIAERKGVEDEYFQKIEERKTLWGKKPYPSTKNVELIRQNMEEESEMTAHALKTLEQSSLSFEPTTGPKCYTDLVQATRSMGELLAQQGVKAPLQFKFGFHRYLAGGQRPPETEDTPMLQKQARVIRELMEIVANSRISELVSFRRAEFEDEDKVKPPVHHPATEPLISSYGDFRCVDLPGYPYTVMPFEISFKSDMEGFRSFLNNLAHSKFIFIPRIMNIENEKKDAMPVKPSATLGGPPPLPDGIVAPTIEQATDPDTLPFVMGEDQLLVGMRIEWFEFRVDKENKGNKEKGGKPDARGRRGGRSGT